MHTASGLLPRGPAVLETLGKRTAATIADSLFVHGTERGAFAIKDGVRKVIDSLSKDEQRRLGLPKLDENTKPLETMDAIRKLVAANYGGALRHEITLQRLDTDDAQASKGLSDRIRYFGYPVQGK